MSSVTFDFEHWTRADGGEPAALTILVTRERDPQGKWRVAGRMTFYGARLTNTEAAARQWLADELERQKRLAGGKVARARGRTAQAKNASSATSSGTAEGVSEQEPAR